MNINQLVQQALDGEFLETEILTEADESELNKYKNRTASRFLIYLDFYRSGRIKIDDLLVSLRNYLLLFKTTVNLPNDIDITDNAYGLRLDENGRCFAVLKCPDYLDGDILKQGFMTEYIPPAKDDRYFLGVTPNIYRLTEYVYYKSIRQKLAVNGTLNMPDGYTALVSLPTGGGKSLVTQAMAFQKEDGLTIVVVPTVSLAMDQVRVAEKAIKNAVTGEIACYHSGLQQYEKSAILDAVRMKKLRLLFISPEALIKNEAFRVAIDEVKKAGYLKNIIIDEAHLVVEWGSFFRTDYQCLEPWRNNLILTNTKLRTVLLSATFEKGAVNTLKSMFSKGDNWLEIRCDALRHEPRFGLITASSWYDKNQKTLELLRVLPRPIIVYVGTPDQAERLKSLALSAGFSNIETFTGKTKSNARQRIIDGWSNNEFDMIIATSAFGVGVDKSDVRTVLHLYVPDNPNAYYQELGRGGRDGLPCLSIMCVYPKEDIDSAFAMTDKVLSSDKILGRWKSMLNSTTSKRINNTYALDTAVKPNYNSQLDFAEDISQVDQQWNIYVILMLRRYELIRIIDMTVDPTTKKYVIRVDIKEQRLLDTSQETVSLIEEIREKEWRKNERDFKVMRDSIYRGSKMCWSEMFFNTYGLVSEYCAGCGNHQNVIASDMDRFELVRKVDTPVRRLADRLNNFFGGSNEAVLLANPEDNGLIGQIVNKGFSIIVRDDNDENYMNLLGNLNANSDINIMGMNEFCRLADHRDLYFISGDIIALYSDSMEDTYKKCMKIRKVLQTGTCRILHIFAEDVYFEDIGKNVTSLIDGPILEEYLIERM